MRAPKTFLLLTLTPLLVLCTASPAQTPLDDVDLRSIVKAIDELYRSKTSYGDIEMTIVTPHWERTLVMKMWTRGMDETLIRIMSPKKETGVGTLRLENDMWNYLPKTNKVIKVPPSMMMSSWMGSDFTNDDLVRESSYIEDYSFEPATVDEPEDGVVYINCIPREDLPVVWANFVAAVRYPELLPIWQKYYDEKKELMRTIYFKNVESMGGRTIPTTLELVPEKKKGNRTVIRYKSVEFDLELDDDVFTLRNLRTP